MTLFGKLPEGRIGETHLGKDLRQTGYLKLKPTNYVFAVVTRN
jgi:hypothetical protein